MASSPPPQSSSAGLPGGNMTPATGAPPAADQASGGGTSSYHIPQFPIERIESKMAAISSRLEFSHLINYFLYAYNLSVHYIFKNLRNTIVPNLCLNVFYSTLKVLYFTKLLYLLK